MATVMGVKYANERNQQTKTHECHGYCFPLHHTVTVCLVGFHDPRMPWVLFPTASHSDCLCLVGLHEASRV